MIEPQSSISLFAHNPENAIANISQVDGNFYGCVELSCETFSGLKIIFTTPGLAEDLAEKLIWTASELRKTQGEQNDTDNK